MTGRPSGKSAPLTAEEMRAMFARGDSVSDIHARARYRDPAMTKARVRAAIYQGANAS